MDKQHSAFMDYLGKELVANVRDASMFDADMIVDGKVKAPFRQQMIRQLAQLSTPDKELVREVVRLCVDNTIHHLLWWLEQEALNEEQHVRVDVMIGGEVVENVAEKSGRAGGRIRGQERLDGSFQQVPCSGMNVCPALERLKMPLPTVFSVFLSLAISCLLVDAECHPFPTRPPTGTAAA